MAARGLAAHAPGIPCGLPSPGSRRQSAGPGWNPMTEDRALIAAPGKPITCKRCKRIVAKSAKA